MVQYWHKKKGMRKGVKFNCYQLEAEYPRWDNVVSDKIGWITQVYVFSISTNPWFYVSDFNCTNYLLPRPLNNTYSIPPAARPVLNTPPPNASQPSSPHPLSHQYTNLNSYQIPPSPVSLADNFDYNIPAFPLPVHSPLDNYQVPGHAIPYHPPTPPTPSSPIDALLPCGYMDMQSPSKQILFVN